MNQVAILRRKRFYQGLMEQGLSSATAIVLEQSPNLTYNSAGVTAHRMLNDIKTMPEFAEEKAKIAELSELDELVTDIARDTKHSGQLKAIELGYRRKGALIDRSINENFNVDQTQEALEQAADRALGKVKSVISTDERSGLRQG